jgi:Protein kinase domain/SdpI/YfhL protein family/SLBB domain
MTSSSSASDPLHGLNPEQLLEIASMPLGSEADTVRLSAPDLPSQEEVARAFPDLEVLELIGRGGMSAVFRARQPRLNRVVALKVLPKSLAALPGFAERFTREGQVLARLTHPHIVTVHDFGERGGFWFLIMEHVDGVNLRQAMRAGRFTQEQALQVIPAICDALQFAHGQGVLHRDIKPENILLDAKGGIKIADFGIAKILGEDVEGAMLLTQSGAKLGTAPYMAPEQIEKPASVDHRADIYSLGVVFYEMLTGELPLGRFAAPSELAAVGGNMDEIVFRALEKERARRQQSAEEFKTQVAGAGTGQGQTKAPKRLERFWMILAGTFLCALLWWLMERWNLTGSFAAAGGSGLPQRAIASATMLMGMLLWGLALPLWLRLVPRNSFYGVRLPSTLVSDERWYEVNVVFGKQLFWWSLTIIGAGIAGFYQLPRHQDAYPWAAITLTVVAVAAVVAATLWWMHQHPVNAPPRPRRRWASWGGQAVVAVVVAFFIKGFILETYRMAGRNEAGVPEGSHWVVTKMDLGFWPGDKIAFEHESGHPYIARVVMREDKGLLLKRGGVEEAFLVPWDRVIGKLLFSHFMPDAVSEELAAIRVVYVFGGVVKPGAVTWREGLTVGDAIQASGGVVPLADIKKLKVVRKKDTMVMAIPTESPETVLNVLLQAGDEIVIPQ